MDISVRSLMECVKAVQDTYPMLQAQRALVLRPGPSALIENFWVRYLNAALVHAPIRLRHKLPTSFPYLTPGKHSIRGGLFPQEEAAKLGSTAILRRGMRCGNTPLQTSPPTTGYLRRCALRVCSSARRVTLRSIMRAHPRGVDI